MQPTVVEEVAVNVDMDGGGPLARELSVTDAQVSGIGATGYLHPESLAHPCIPVCPRLSRKTIGFFLIRPPHKNLRKRLR